MSIFPIIQPQTEEVSAGLKLYKEVKWDYEKNIPVFENGTPVMVTGNEAILVWAWKALLTSRYRHEIYSWDYGCEIETLIGQSFTKELKQAEATRYVRECLLINPYINDVSNITISFDEDRLGIGCTIETVYGEARINV